MTDAERLQEWLATYEPSVHVDLHDERIVMRPARAMIGTFRVETPRSGDLCMDLDSALRRLVNTTS